MLVEHWSSEVTDQAEPINNGPKQVTRNQIFFADSHFIFLIGLLYNDLPYTLGCIAVAKHELYQCMTAFQKNSIDKIQGYVFKFLKRKVGNKMIELTSEDG